MRPSSCPSMRLLFRLTSGSLESICSTSSLPANISRIHASSLSSLAASALKTCPSAPAFQLQQHQRIARFNVVRSFASNPSTGKSWGQIPPVTFQSLLIAMMVGAGVITAVKTYRDEKLQKVMSQSQQVVGKASVGGPFELIDQDGKPFSDQDLLGEFAVLYFGFTHCPDICPDEMEKLAEAVTALEKQVGVNMQTVFLSVDPERDTPKLVKEYVAEFHPLMKGLTGSLEAIKKVSKAYRVYYNKTSDSDEDYLVDHSIIHYLISPAGEFVTFFSKSFTAEQMTAAMAEQMYTWQQTHPNYHKGKKFPAPAVKAGGAKPTEVAASVKVIPE